MTSRLAPAMDRRRFLVQATTLAAAWYTLRHWVDPARAGFPRVVRDAVGREVVVAAPPQRIVVPTEYAALDSVLALGARPVAAVRRHDWPWTLAAGGGAVPRFPEHPLASERARLADLDPDLVLLLRNEAHLVGQWETLATTVCYDGDDAQACLRLVGEVLGLTDRAETVGAAFEARLGAARERIRAAGREGATFASVIVFPDGSAGLYGAQTGDAVLLRGLGLVPNALTAGHQGWTALTPDLVRRLDADVLVGRQEEPDTDAGWARFEADPAFRALPAVADGRYARLSWTVGWAVACCSVPGWDAALDRLVEIVVATARSRR